MFLNHSFPPPATKLSTERRCEYVQGIATYKGKIIQATREFGYFGGTAQKEQLVYLARGAMSMSELMANPTHSTIIGI